MAVKFRKISLSILKMSSGSAGTNSKASIIKENFKNDR